jgi:diketogulonate reductase-like aldo/keto reductase
MDLTLGSTIRLNNGAEMPRLGLGVYQVPEGAITETVVAWALADGYRHIDTAELYRNEASVGLAVRESGIPRGDIWVTTKLWPTDFLHVQSAFDLSMTRLGLEYVDLYLIHFPVPGLIGRVWKAMESIAASGRARAIGVSNFRARQLAYLLQHSTIPPSVNQVRASVFAYNHKVYELCQAENVAFEAYSPLRRGKDHDHPVVTRAAAGYDKSPAQVMLRWALQKNMVVIPKSQHEARIAQNADIFDFAISDADMGLLDALASQSTAVKLATGSWWWTRADPDTKRA